MKAGSIRLSHDEPEMEKHRGIKIVDKKILPGFVTNEYEK